MNKEIKFAHEQLKNHPLYTKLTSLEHLKTFMEYHVFVVWDFMSLLKSLQRQITCVELPWFDSPYDPKLVRLINEIVLGEESDKDFNGQPASHFSLYIKAMEEIGADTSKIKNFIKSRNLEFVPSEIRHIVEFHLNTAQGANVHEVCSAFFFGREKLIPDMFQSIVDIVLEYKLDCPTLLYYFKRHIELDADEHGPMAMECLNKLIDTEQKEEESLKMALRSLQKRNELWNIINDKI